MKTILTATIVAIIFSISNIGYAEDSNSKTSHGAWGSRRECPDGRGLCNVTTKVNDETAPIVMNWLLSNDQTTLSLTISEEMIIMTPEQIVTGLQNGHFIMEDDFTFSAEITNLLGAEPGLTIPKGDYQVTHSSQGYTIHFELE